MKIMDILNFNLERLFGAAPAPPGHYWFLSPTKSEKRRPRGPRLRDARVTPVLEYPEYAARRRGPVYLRNQPWRRDLNAVLEQIRAIVRTNGNLPDGLMAAAREEHRFTRGFHITRVFSFMLLLAAVFLAPGGTIVFYFLWDGLRSHSRRERVFLVLAQRVSQGVPLSEAMAGLRRFFPAFFADMVRAGEESGDMPACLEHLGADTIRRLNAASSMAPNVVYLLTVAFIQSALALFLSVKVLPLFREISAEFQGDVPPTTEFMMRTVERAESLVSGGGALAIFLGVFAGFVAYLFLRAATRRRELLSRWSTWPMVFIPGLRGLHVKQNLGTAALKLNLLLTAGAPLPDALTMAGTGDIHRRYARVFRALANDITQGDSLAEACARRGALPKSFRNFVTLGERAGMLPDAFRRIADFYHRDVDKTTRVLSDALLPLGVLVLGGIGLTYELGVMGCIVQLTDLMLRQM